MGGCWRCNMRCLTSPSTQQNAVVVKDGGELVTYLQRQESDSKTQLACFQSQALQVPNTTSKRPGLPERSIFEGPNRRPQSHPHRGWLLEPPLWHAAGIENSSDKTMRHVARMEKHIDSMEQPGRVCEFHFSFDALPLEIGRGRRISHIADISSKLPQRSCFTNPAIARANNGASEYAWAKGDFNLNKDNGECTSLGIIRYWKANQLGRCWCASTSMCV